MKAQIKIPEGFTHLFSGDTIQSTDFELTMVTDLSTNKNKLVWWVVTQKIVGCFVYKCPGIAYIRKI